MELGVSASEKVRVAAEKQRPEKWESQVEREGSETKGGGVLAHHRRPPAPYEGPHPLPLDASDSALL